LNKSLLFYTILTYWNNTVFECTNIYTIKLFFIF